MVGGMEDTAGDMRDSDADESDGSAESGDTAGEESGSHDDEESRARYIDSQPARVVFAKHQSVEGFECQHDKECTEKDDRY